MMKKITKPFDNHTIYAGGHVGSRGSLSSVRHSGGEDFSDIDMEWEQMVKAVMISRDASFSMQWHGDWENLDDLDTILIMTQVLWGAPYRKRDEQVEPPFGRR